MKTKKKAKPKRRRKLILGATYKDQITGFEGVASGIVKYMTGCDQVLLAPQARNGVKLDAHWFDKPRVIRMPGKIIKLDFANDADFDTKDRGADIAPPAK